MSIDALDHETRRLELVRQLLSRLLGTDRARLPEAVAVENRQDVGQRPVDNEVNRLGDLALARLPVADDAVDPLVQPIVPRRDPQARGHREPLSQRTSRGVEKGKPFHGAWVTVQARISLPEGHDVVDRHGPDLVAQSEGHPEVTEGGVQDGNRMALGEDEPVGGRVTGVLRQPPHRVVQEDGHDVAKAQAAGGMAAAGCLAHVEAQMIELDRLRVNGCFKRHPLPFGWATSRPSNPVVSHQPPPEANRARRAKETVRSHPAGLVVHFGSSPTS